MNIGYFTTFSFIIKLLVYFPILQIKELFYVLSQCGHQTDGGKFCEKCGSPLLVNQASGRQFKLEPRKTSGKAVRFFVLAVLKRPYQECKTTGGEQLISAVITMVLFSLLTL